MNELLIHIGSALVILWGIAHIIPTGKVLATFWGASPDNKKLFIMEWVSEGLTLIFLGLLVSGILLVSTQVSELYYFVVYLASGMLVGLAILTFLTGARTELKVMKFCPLVKISVVILWMLGIYLS